MEKSQICTGLCGGGFTMIRRAPVLSHFGVVRETRKIPLYPIDRCTQNM